MPETASIGLDANLQESLAPLFRDGLNSQARRVGVSTNHRDRIARLSWSSQQVSFIEFNTMSLIQSLYTFHLFPMAKATIVEQLRVK